MAVGSKKYYVYVVPHEKKQGITDNWKECEKIVSGKPDARYRGFRTKNEAKAWLALGARYDVKRVKKLEPGIYFDAGTGRGKGVEVNVTDASGKSLLHKVIPKKKLSRHATHVVGDAATNNYGELLGLSYALKIAEKDGIKKVFGDSKLVIDFWSKWRIKRNDVPPETARLAKEVAEERLKFERCGGSVRRISGADNPADLGFHR